MNKEEFKKALADLNIVLTIEKEKLLEKYYIILIEENKKYNLTAIVEEQEVYLKHFYDSLTITKALKLNDQYLLDVGTGAGFPGIILKIFFPKLRIDLLDATLKKCIFLKKIITELNLKDITVINARAEEYAKQNREKYDIITSRAVAPLKHLLEYSIPMLKIHGKFIALKGELTEEIKNINNYYKLLNLDNEQMIKFDLPNNKGTRTIYIVDKIAKTSLKYPRKYSIIKKYSL